MATIVSDTGTQIVATSPAGTGTVDVTVTTAGGTSSTSAADEFTYLPANSSLSGYVYMDTTDSGQREISPDVYKLGIPDVTVTLEPTGATALTQSDGSYQFTSLPAGTYSIVETQPPQYLPGGIDTAGSLGGQGSTNDTISQIVVPAGQNGTEYDFGEWLLAPGYLSKRDALASTPTTQALVDQVIDPPPVVQLGGSSTNFAASYTAGESSPVAVPIASPSATITYAGSDLASLTVTITNLKDGSAEGFLIGNQTFNASTVSAQQVTELTSFPKISATFAACVLTLTGVDTVGDYQGLLQSISWEDTAASPNTSPRYITVVADDAIAASNTATTTITDPPAVTAASPVHTTPASTTPAPHLGISVASSPSSASLADQVLASVNDWLAR